ncbi:MAG: hypothetical protein M3Y82_07080, partial [Verrucomicrobiota bacterium]|nr:hypothetical protein [Verrucomicrobiota bacterium]
LHMAWGNPNDKTNYFPLPFYQFEWLRKDVKKVELGGTYYPQVFITVSGLDQQTLSYRRQNLPICGDFDVCSKKGKKPNLFRTPPDHPNFTDRYLRSKQAESPDF